MTRLKTFLDDENCWWKIFKKREFSCCEQKSPHLHGYLDGTMVTLKMLEENVEVFKFHEQCAQSFISFLDINK